MSVLNISTNIFTSIAACPVILAAILVIMSLVIFKSVFILYLSSLSRAYNLIPLFRRENVLIKMCYIYEISIYISSSN